MDANKRLPPSIWKTIVAHLIEQGEDNLVRIRIASLNNTERRVEVEHTFEGSGDDQCLVLSTVDVDSDATDLPTSDQFPFISGKDLGTSFNDP